MDAPTMLVDQFSNSSNLSTKYGGCSEADFTKCECIMKLFTQISQLLKKKATYAENFESQLFSHKWCLLFAEFILGNAHCTLKDCNAHNDDMLWYVPFVKIISTDIGSMSGHLQVFRRQSRNKPILGDNHVNWEETVYLNLILQQLDYYVTCAVCTKTPPNNLQIHRKNCQKVYPSPSRRRMDVKGECEEITYPRIYFAIDNFDDVFSNMVVTEGECICVELVAHDRYRCKEAVLFLGSIRYDMLRKLYDSRNSGTWNWAQKLMTNASKRCYEFVIMRGPRGRGRAEMAVARADSCGFETPMSDSFDLRSAFNNDSLNNNYRRVSDTNVFNRTWFGFGGSSAASGLKREAMTPGPGTSMSLPFYQPASQRQRRWQSDSASVCEDRSSVADQKSINGDDLINSCTNYTNNGSTWSMRGIGQALHFLREKSDSVPLNAFLTNIMLPWNAILDNILSPTTKTPLLTFELDFLQNQLN